MADEPVTSTPFADYIRVENAKERAGEPPSPIQPVPESSSEVIHPEDRTAESSAGAGGPSAPAEPSPEPDTPPEPIAASGERNPDGTFKKRDRVQERIDKAVAAQRQAERDRDELRAKVAALEGQRTPNPPVAAPDVAAPASDEPTLEQFINDPDPYLSLTKALAKYEAKKLVAEQEQQRQVTTRQQEAIARVNDNIDAGRAKYPDWDQAMQDDGASVMLPGYVLEAIHESEHAADLVYYLSRHADEARVIAAKPPTQALLHLGQLVTQSRTASNGSVPAAPVVSRAKPPIKPVGATPTAPDASPPDDLPFGPDYIRAMNAKERKMREARGY